MTAAAGEVRTDLREDGAMVVTIDNPPANALTPALRGQLLLALVEARSRGARAVVLTGAGHNFSAAS
jgi:3-hydroxyacyl-CoA dehydrogenase